MRLVIDHLIAVDEGGPSIARPRHLEHARRPLDSFDAESLAEPASVTEVIDELRHGAQECCLLAWGK